MSESRSVDEEAAIVPSERENTYLDRILARRPDEHQHIVQFFGAIAEWPTHPPISALITLRVIFLKCSEFLSVAMLHLSG
jgi:hypothetical protein